MTQSFAKAWPEPDWLSEFRDHHPTFSFYRGQNQGTKKNVTCMDLVAGLDDK